MSRKERAPGCDSRGPTSTPPPSGSTRIVPRDPDLWVVLVVLDRAFGANQVTVVNVTPRNRA
jgi:hypothetical protein